MEEIALVTLRTSDANKGDQRQFALSEKRRKQVRYHSICMEDVEKFFGLKNIWFEEEGQMGSIITNNVLKPSKHYIVHGEKPQCTEDQQGTLKGEASKLQSIRKTALAYNENHFLHSGWAKHPENPSRISFAINLLEEKNLIEKFYTVIKGRRATDEEIMTVHPKKYLEGIHEWINGGQAKNLASSSLSCEASMLCSKTAENSFKSGSDVYLNEHSVEVARNAVGSLLEVVEKVMNNEVDNGFALIRPPGHHASKEEATGFCIFNNVAIAAKFAIQKNLAKRVVILDWDVHHGNGTQNIVYDDEKILFISLHRFGSGFYPNSGDISECGGHSSAKGMNVNIPLDGALITDGNTISLFNLIIFPIISEFSPDLILVSAGFDSVKGDPIGGGSITPELYGYLTHLLLPLGKVVMALEGGYHLQQIAQCVYHCCNVLLGAIPTKVNHSGEYQNLEIGIEDVVRNVVEYHHQHWKSLSLLKKILK